MRVLGLDYGSVTVGVAVSDALGITAQPLMTIRREQENKLRRTLAIIQEIAAEYEVETIVLGNSHTYYGIRPELLPYAAVNLANVSQTLDIDLLLLEYYAPRLKREVDYLVSKYGIEL